MTIFHVVIGLVILITTKGFDEKLPSRFVSRQSESSPFTGYDVCSSTNLNLPNIFNRIVGGEIARKDEFPWQVSMQWRRRSYTYHVCGGAIVSQSWILTAAHCTREFNPKSLIIVAGDYKLKNQEGEEKVHYIENVIEHEEYNVNSQENDIALVKVTADFALDGKTISPVCLPFQEQTFTGDCIVSGWGKLREGGKNAEVLQKASLPIISDEECSRRMSESGYEYPITSGMLCAGIREGGRDACQGDSGGPLVCPGFERVPVLAGIVSWGIGCARPIIPGVYTEVSKYTNWVRSKLGISTPSTENTSIGSSPSVWKNPGAMISLMFGSKKDNVRLNQDDAMDLHQEKKMNLQEPWIVPARISMPMPRGREEFSSEESESSEEDV